MVSVAPGLENGRTAVAPGTELAFDGSQSVDPDGEIQSYEWTVDGQPAGTGPQFTRTFDVPGTYPVTLTVDDGQTTESAEIAVVVTQSVGNESDGEVPDNLPPVAALDAPETTVPTGDAITLSAAESEDLDGDAFAEFRWDFDGDGRVERNTAGPTTTVSYDDPGEREVSVVAVDTVGGTGSASATTDLGTAATDDELVALASTLEDPTGTTDLFALSRRFRPDLTVDATAQTDAAAVGTGTTIEYTVTNRGDTTAPPTVVVLRGRTGGVDSATIPELGVGESTTATFSATVDRAGEFEVVVDPARQLNDRNRTNNDAAVVLARPDLGVSSVSERRADDQLQVEIGVENTGTVPAGPFDVRVEAGNRTATGSLPGLGAGREIPVTVGLNASGLGSSVSATVTVDPAGAVDEPDTTDNTRLVTLLQPDLAVAEPVTVAETEGGASVQFGIRNGDTGAARATATLVTAEEVVSQTIEIPPARDANDTTVVRTALNVSTVPEEGAFGIRVEPETIDADPTDNVFGQPPGGFPEPQPELSLSVESPESDTTVPPGETVPVRVAFENTGDGRARQTLTVEGPTTVEQRFEVPPGDVTAFTVEVAAPQQAGQFDLTLQAGDLSQTLSLQAGGNESTNQTASTPGPDPGSSGGGGSFPVAVLVVVVVLALGVLAYRRMD